MMYGFCYKRGSLSYDRVKSLVNAIDFELPPQLGLQWRDEQEGG